MRSPEKEDKLSARLGRFWRTLFLTEDGRPKSTVLLYSFALGFVFVAIYVLVFVFLTVPLSKLFRDDQPTTWIVYIFGFPLTWKSLIESVILGLLGSAVCCGLSLLIKERAIPAGAYIWLTVYLVIMLIAMIFIAKDPDAESYNFQPEVYRLFLFYIVLYVPAGLLSGTIFTHHRYGVFRRAKLRKEQELAEKEKEER